MKKNQIYILTVLVAALSFGSCMKKQNLDDQDLGPAISSDDLQSKMGESIGSLSYDQIRKSEINSIVASSTLEETQTTNRYKQDLYVTKITNTATDMTIDFLFNRQDYLSASNSLSNQSYQLIIEGSRSAKISSLMAKADLSKAQVSDVSTRAVTPFFLYRAYVYFAIQGCRENGVSCHNLKIDSSKTYLPAESASPTVCPDISKCQIDIKKIQFDMLDRTIATDDGKPYRTHYTFIVSPQLPFLSKVMRYCVRGLTDMGGRKVLAEDCTALNDFSYGQEP